MKLNSDDILLAFHLKSCFPDLGIGLIADSVCELKKLSKKIFDLEKVLENPIFSGTRAKKLLPLQKQAKEIGIKLGVEILLIDEERATGALAIKLPNGVSNSLSGYWEIAAK
jgi:hypothetical protein